MAKKRTKRPPQSGKNYIQRMADKRDLEFHIVQMWSFQLSLDIIAGVLHSDYGFGSERLTRLGELYNKALPDYVRAIQKDPEADYYRDLIERQQEQIFGKDRLKWAERYEYWGEMV